MVFCIENNFDLIEEDLKLNLLFVGVYCIGMLLN